MPWPEKAVLHNEMPPRLSAMVDRKRPDEDSTKPLGEAYSAVPKTALVVAGNRYIK